MPVLARTFRTKFLAVVLSALCGLTVFSASSSSADTSAQRLEQARRELRVAQQDADKLAQRFADAEATAETLDDQIAATKRSIVATSRNMQRVRADVVRLVVSLYANDRHGDVSVVDSGASLVESGRAAQYARIIAERDQLAIERFRAQRTTLTTQQRALAAAKAEQAKVLLEINRATSAIDAKLATLATLQRELGTKIVNEEADARRAANEAERRLQEIRRDAAKTAIGPSKKDSPTSTAPSNEPVPRPAPGPKPPARATWPSMPNWPKATAAPPR